MGSHPSPRNNGNGLENCATARYKTLYYERCCIVGVQPLLAVKSHGFRVLKDFIVKYDLQQKYACAPNSSCSTKYLCSNMQSNVSFILESCESSIVLGRIPANSTTHAFCVAQREVADSGTHARRYFIAALCEWEPINQFPDETDHGFSSRAFFAKCGVVLRPGRPDF